MRIRRAVGVDAAGIEAIVGRAYGHYVARIGKKPGPMLDDYGARVRAGAAWVAECEGSLAGILVLLAEADGLLLHNVAVDPAWQGRGIGRALIGFAEEEARRLGHRRLRLFTHELMTENIALYRALGWQETGRGAQSGYQRVFFEKSV